VTRNHLKNGHKKTKGQILTIFVLLVNAVLENKKIINAAQELKIYKNSDLALSSLQSAAARWHQRPSWPWNHVFKKSRYLSYFFIFI